MSSHSISLASRLLFWSTTLLAGRTRPRQLRSIGMDDWQGSIGTSHPDLLWPAFHNTRTPASPWVPFSAARQR